MASLEEESVVLPNAEVSVNLSLISGPKKSKKSRKYISLIDFEAANPSTSVSISSRETTPEPPHDTSPNLEQQSRDSPEPPINMAFRNYHDTTAFLLRCINNREQQTIVCPINLQIWSHTGRIEEQCLQDRCNVTPTSDFPSFILQMQTQVSLVADRIFENDKRSPDRKVDLLVRALDVEVGVMYRGMPLFRGECVGGSEALGEATWVQWDLVPGPTDCGMATYFDTWKRWILQLDGISGSGFTVKILTVRQTGATPAGLVSGHHFMRTEADRLFGHPAYESAQQFSQQLALYQPPQGHEKPIRTGSEREQTDTGENLEIDHERLTEARQEFARAKPGEVDATAEFMMAQSIIYGSSPFDDSRPSYNDLVSMNDRLKSQGYTGLPALVAKPKEPKEGEQPLNWSQYQKSGTGGEAQKYNDFSHVPTFEVEYVFVPGDDPFFNNHYVKEASRGQPRGTDDLFESGKDKGKAKGSSDLPDGERMVPYQEFPDLAEAILEKQQNQNITSPVRQARAAFNSARSFDADDDQSFIYGKRPMSPASPPEILKRHAEAQAAAAAAATALSASKSSNHPRRKSGKEADTSNSEAYAHASNPFAYGSAYQNAMSGYSAHSPMASMLGYESIDSGHMTTAGSSSGFAAYHTSGESKSGMNPNAPAWNTPPARAGPSNSKTTAFTYSTPTHAATGTTFSTTTFNPYSPAFRSHAAQAPSNQSGQGPFSSLLRGLQIQQPEINISKPQGFSTGNPASTSFKQTGLMSALNNRPHAPGAGLATLLGSSRHSSPFALKHPVRFDPNNNLLIGNTTAPNVNNPLSGSANVGTVASGTFNPLAQGMNPFSGVASPSQHTTTSTTISQTPPVRPDNPGPGNNHKSILPFAPTGPSHIPDQAYGTSMRLNNQGGTQNSKSLLHPLQTQGHYPSAAAPTQIHAHAHPHAHGRSAAAVAGPSTRVATGNGPRHQASRFFGHTGNRGVSGSSASASASVSTSAAVKAGARAATQAVIDASFETKEGEGGFTFTFRAPPQ